MADKIMHLLDIKSELDKGTPICKIPMRDKILAVKDARRLRQEDMAAALGISRTYYGTLERGEHYNPKYDLGAAIDTMLLEILYGGNTIDRSDMIGKLGTLFKCVQHLKGLLEPGSEEVKYANMALKCTQTIASRIKGKSEV